MKLLLDTQIYLWLNTDDARLSADARRLIEEAQEVFVSAASFWEAAIKISKGALDARLVDLRAALHANGFTELPITIEHACAVESLPWHHKDPYDRMLVAQAMTEPLHLLTADHQLVAYSKLVIQA